MNGVLELGLDVLKQFHENMNGVWLLLQGVYIIVHSSPSGDRNVILVHVKKITLIGYSLLLLLL